MVILRKKRILAVVCMVIMCVVACTAQTNQNKQNNNSSLETTQVVALPVTNKVVVIDAGHRNSR